MVTRRPGVRPKRRAAAGRGKAALGWFAWAACVLILSILAHRVGSAAEPRWAEAVALVLVIAAATVAMPPVLARISRLPVNLPVPSERGQEASVMPIGPSRGPSSLAG